MSEESAWMWNCKLDLGSEAFWLWSSVKLLERGSRMISQSMIRQDSL